MSPFAMPPRKKKDRSTKAKKKASHKEVPKEEEKPTSKTLRLKTPIYTQDFTHVSSHVGYKGFLEGIVQLNGSSLQIVHGRVGYLPFCARKFVEQAWVDLLKELFQRWDTIHSEDVKRVALERSLAQVSPDIYEFPCKDKQEKENNFSFGDPYPVFTPIVTKFQNKPRPVPHPDNLYRVTEFPCPPPRPKLKRKLLQKKPKKKPEPQRGEKDDIKNDPSYYSSRIPATSKKRKRKSEEGGATKKKARMESEDVIEKNFVEAGLLEGDLTDASSAEHDIVKDETLNMTQE